MSLAIRLLPFRPKVLSAGVIIMFSMLMMWIGADYIYGAYSPIVRNIMTIYFFLFTITYVMVNKTPKIIEGSGESLSNFALGFFITALPLFFLFSAIGILGQTANIVEPFIATITITGIGFGALHGFVKAYVEESVFRWAIPKHAGAGDILANILFGLFHFFVLIGVTIPGLILAGGLVDLGAMNFTYAIVPMMVLTVLGLFWSQVRNHFGIMGSTGSHFAWNLFALGVLPIIFIGGVA